MVKNTDNFIMLLTGELYTDLMEIHMLELRKLPSEAQNEKGIIHWMRFLGGKKREEFEDMAKQDEYIGDDETRQRDRGGAGPA